MHCLTHGNLSKQVLTSISFYVKRLAEVTQLQVADREDHSCNWLTLLLF